MTTATQSSQWILRSQNACKSFCDARWEVCAFTQRNPFKTSSNEDAAAVISAGDDSLVLVVADGCGGMRGGDKASRLAIRQITRSVRNRGANPRCVRGAILDGIELANTAVQSLKIGAACTIAVVEYYRGRIRSYHVGDSSVLVTSSRGRIRYQSVCHSPVGYAVEGGWFDENEAMYHEDRHLVSNFVGSPRMRIEVGPWIGISKYDRVVIASDGLFDNLWLEEITEQIRRRELGECVGRLSKLATQRMHFESDSFPCKPDDLTIVAMKRR